MIIVWNDPWEFYPNRKLSSNPALRKKFAHLPQSASNIIPAAASRRFIAQLGIALK